MRDRAKRRILHKSLGNVEKRIARKRYACLFPGCENSAIQSHSQQRERQLRSIARDGKVYAFNGNLYKIYEKRADVVQLVGISEASVFYGFCHLHDQSLFAPIDNNPLQENNCEQAHLMFLRTNCYEYAQKTKVADKLSMLLDVLIREHIDADLEVLQTHLGGIGNYINVSAPFFFERIWRHHIDKDFSEINTVWKKIDKNLGVSCSCVYSPLLGEYDRYIRRNYDLPQPLVSFNVVPSVDNTHVIFSWLKEHDQYANWIVDRTSSTAGLELLINQSAFAESEDTCISPLLWERLGPVTQGGLMNAMRHWAWRGPLQTMPLVISI